jgi:gliding motility-associated-like protein
MLAILLTTTLPVLAQNTLPDKVCVGTERHYRVTGSPNSIYTWKINGVIQNSVSNVLDITWTKAGVYTLDLQEHQNDCNSDIRTGLVTVVDVPTLIRTSDLLVWAQSPIETLDANTRIVHEAGINVVWYDAAFGGTAIVSPTLNEVGIKTYYAEANNGFCKSPTRIPVTLTILPVHIIPTVDSQLTNDNTPLITGTATVVNGETLQVTVNGLTYTAGDGKLTLTGTNWSLQIPSGSEILEGTYSVSTIVTDALGNSSSDLTDNELVIDTTPPIIPTVNSQASNDHTPLISGTATVGVGEKLKVTVNGITYTAGDGEFTLIGLIWSLQIPSGSEILDGTYSVTATVSDLAGNMANDQTSNELIIRTKRGPVAVDDVFTTSEIAFEGNLGLNDIAFEGAQLRYNTMPVMAPVKGDVIINADGTFTYKRKTTGSGVDEFIYQVCDNGSPVQCSQARVVINFNTRKPVARILGAPSLVLGNCNTADQLLDASSSSGDGLVYNWFPSIYLDNASSSKPKFHSGETTRYHLTVTDSEGQKDTTSILVMITDGPKAITDRNVFVNSPTASILLNGAKSSGVGLIYLWKTKEGIILNGGTQATAKVSGLGMYYLQVSDAFGCLNQDSVNVGLYIQAISDTAQTKTNQSVTINVARNDIPQNAINPSSISIVTPPVYGTASVAADSLVLYAPDEFYVGQDEFVYSICDYFGNCDNAKVLVLINDLPFFIPDAFSPNGDGFNDRFVIQGLEKYKTVEIEIFNRWGNVVYQSSHYGEGNNKTGFWDGTASTGMRVGSGMVPTGTYYYILKMNGQQNMTGAVYLDR